MHHAVSSSSLLMQNIYHWHRVVWFTFIEGSLISEKMQETIRLGSVKRYRKPFPWQWRESARFLRCRTWHSQKHPRYISFKSNDGIVTTICGRTDPLSNSRCLSIFNVDKQCTSLINQELTLKSWSWYAYAQWMLFVCFRFFTCKSFESRM